MFQMSKSYQIDELEQRFFKRENWFVNKKKMTVLTNENMLIARANGKKKSYLMFLNNERKFSTIKNNKIIFNEDIYVKFSGHLSERLDATIYLLQYNEKMKRVKTDRLKLNEGKWIHSKGVHYLRLVIRCVGVGELIIHHCTMMTREQMGLLQSQPPRLNEVVVAAILDEFSAACFQDVVSLLTFTP